MTERKHQQERTMKREECRIGMHVYFGLKQGQKTLGEVVKLNDKSAKVKILEQRGHGRGCIVGKNWNVHYDLMFPAPVAGKVVQAQNKGVPTMPGDKKLVYSPFQPQEDIHILQAIACIYANLSPENLSCDGEIPPAAVEIKRRELNAKLSALQTALGRTVSEWEVREWERQRREKFKVSETAD
jgi:hypothetical protein